MPAASAAGPHRPQSPRRRAAAVARRAAPLAGAALLLACAGAPTPPPPARPGAAVPGEPAGPQAASPAMPTGGAPTAAPVAGTPMTGVDAEINALAETLAGAGVAVSYLGSRQVDWFASPAEIFAVGDPGRGDTLEVHRHPDPEAARSDAERVAPDGHSIIDPTGVKMAVLWGGTPHYYLRGPLLAIYVGSDPTLLEALSAALGPPFAGGS